MIISDRLWRRRFGGDPGAIGKQLRLETFSYTIVGVMPASFLFPVRDVDLWSPVPVNFPFAMNNRDISWYTGVGRLKPGISVAQARADLALVQTRLGSQYPAPDARLAVKIEPLKEVNVGGIRRSLWILFGSVSLLLVLACSNIASLLLAQTSRRTHEIAVRFSLGASRAAVTRQLLAETFVLALAGCLLALLVAAAATGAFHSLARNLPRGDEVRLDWTILLYSLGCAVAATILCGMLPALRATGGSVTGSLAQFSRTQVSARGPLQWAQVSMQVALAVTLLAGAGLLLRSFQALGRVSPGFDASHVLALRISGNYGETGNMQALIRRIDRTLDSLRSVPGVETAATSGTAPGTPLQFHAELRISGEPAEMDRKILVDPRAVSAGYFAALQIPLVSGEVCREALVPNSVVVNRRFVDTYLAGGPVIGRHLEYANRNQYTPPPAEIRGVVGDAREEGLDREPAPTVYWCFTGGTPNPVYLVRTHGDPMAMAEVLRRKIHEIEPARAVFDVMPLSEHLSENFAANRLRTILLSFFAVTAVTLACVGLYGTLSRVALALGALRGQIVGQFLLYGFRACLLGCAAGLCLAAASARLLSGMLFGISSWDATTFIGALLLILITAGVASLLPALRAARVEPMQVLRDQ